MPFFVLDGTIDARLWWIYVLFSPIQETIRLERERLRQSCPPPFAHVLTDKLLGRELECREESARRREAECSRDIWEDVWLLFEDV